MNPNYINTGNRQLVLSHKVNGRWAVRIIGAPLPADHAALLAMRLSRRLGWMTTRCDARRAAEILYRQEAQCGRLTVRVTGGGYLSLEYAPALQFYSKPCPVDFSRQEVKIEEPRWEKAL